MRISSKGRYGLAAMTSMAQDFTKDNNVTIISIAEKLGISKIYLEQVFSLLKRAKIVISIKGAQGGYKLAASPDKITAGQVLRAIESGIFEPIENSVEAFAPAIETAMENLVWNPLDKAVVEALDGVTLENLVNETERQQDGKNLMFYI